MMINPGDKCRECGYVLPAAQADPPFNPFGRETPIPISVEDMEKLEGAPEPLTVLVPVEIEE